MSRASLNKVMLVGNLGADPDIRFTPNGTQVATVSLATNDIWTDRTGERHPRTEWHQLVLWRRLAEIASQHLTKGTRLYVEGRLQSRTWDDGSNHRHRVTEVYVTDLRLVDDAGGPGELDLEYMGGSNADLAAASHMLTSPVVGCAGAEEDGLPF